MIKSIEVIILCYLLAEFYLIDAIDQAKVLFKRITLFKFAVSSNLPIFF